MSDIATFHAAFEKASVTIKVDYSRFQNGGHVTDILDIQWSNSPAPEVIPQYINWMHTVMSEVAQSINDKIFYAYPAAPGGQNQYFTYFADGSYESFAPVKQ